MERLTKRGVRVERKTVADDIINRLAELEDKIESGELVELPCKVGDEVYAIIGFVPAVEEFEISEINLCKGNVWYRMTGKDFGAKAVFSIRDYGVRWFADLEAAEARLKELQEEKK